MSSARLSLRLAGPALMCLLLLGCAPRMNAPELSSPEPAPAWTQTAAATSTPSLPPPTETPLPALPTLSIPAPQASGLLELDGDSLYYEVYGSGPVVVLIHDGLVDRRTWDLQVQAFAQSNTVIRYDRRGYGSSSLPTRPFSDVDDLYQLMMFLNVEKATLTGLSYGSQLAVTFTLAHPEMVEALVLCGPVISGLNDSAHYRARNASNHTAEDWINDPYLTAPGNETARAFLRERFPQLPPLQTIARFRKPEPAALGRLDEVKVPILIVVGEADLPDVHAHAGAIQAGIWESLRVVLDDGGHLVPMEQPDVFNRTVLNFLRDRRAP